MNFFDALVWLWRNRLKSFIRNRINPPMLNASSSTINHNVLSPPTVAVVRLSDVCNCECIMCSVRTQRPLSTNKCVSLETYKQIIKLLPPTIRIIAPSGLGDITLHPNFPEVIQISRECFQKIFITTNGTMLLKYIDMCLLIDQIQISVNASNSERYIAITKRDFFSKVICGVEALVEAGHKNVQFNFVVQPESIDDIRDFVDLARRLHIKRVNLIPCVDTRVWQTFNPDLSSEVAYGRSKGVDVAVMGKGKDNICSSPSYNFIVDGKFDVQYCCMNPTTKPVGNLLDESWGTIWYGKNFSAWRKQMLSSNPPIPCVNCP